MSPPAKTPGCPVIRSGPTRTTPSAISTPGSPSTSSRSDSCPRGQDDAVGRELLEFSGRLWEAAVVEAHLLDRDAVITGVRDRRQPSHAYALLDGLLDLDVVRRHPFAGPPVHDHGIGGSEPPGGTGDVHRGVAAAVDRDPAAEQRRLTVLDVGEDRDGVHDPRGVAGGDVGPPADVRTDGEEDGVELSVELVEQAGDIGHRGAELDRHAHVGDPLDLCVDDVAGEPVGRDAVAHHPARGVGRVADRDVVSEQAQVVRRRQPGRPGTDHEDVPAGRLGGHRDGPAALDRLVAEEALDGVDPDRLVQGGAVAGGLAGAVADPPHHRGERVVGHDLAPGVFVRRLLGVVQPLLHVLAGRAGVVAGRQPVDVHGPLGAPGTGLVGKAGADAEGDGEWA